METFSEEMSNNYEMLGKIGEGTYGTVFFSNFGTRVFLLI